MARQVTQYKDSCANPPKANTTVYPTVLAGRTGRPGVALGLCWSAAGGDVLVVEARRMPGSGGLVLTGRLGEVMQESAQVALSWLRANAGRYGVDPAFPRDTDVHLHLSGEVRKEGASAGLTMVAAMVSAFTGRPVRGGLAMTGEITLSGHVLPVGTTLFAAGEPPLLLTHVPLPQVPTGCINVHGHVHGKASPSRNRHINVSVEQLNYRPARLCDIRRLALRLVEGRTVPGRRTSQRLRIVETTMREGRRARQPRRSPSAPRQRGALRTAWWPRRSRSATAAWPRATGSRREVRGGTTRPRRPDRKRRVTRFAVSSAPSMDPRVPSPCPS